MDLELVKFINSDLTWTAVKRGQRSMTRRLKRTKAGCSEFGSRSGIKKHDKVVLDYEKSGVSILGEEVLDVPIKKRILLLQSPCQAALPPQPQTPSPQHELSVSREHSSEALEQTEKAVPDLNDFSGIELLAAAACHSSVNDTSGNVESSAVEEQLPPRVEPYPSGVKQDISLVDSLVQDNTVPTSQTLCDNGNGESNKSSVPSKVARWHWDLNTVMEEWDEPCDILVDSHSEKSSLQDVHNDRLGNESQVTGGEQGSLLSGKPEMVGDSLGKTCDAESGLSKSDVVDSVVNPAKCENVSTSTASVSLEETTIKFESVDKQAVSEVVQGGCLSLKGDTVVKLTSEDHLSDCCGSNVSQDKVKSGYDSPVEDGEFREPAANIWENEELEELDCVDYESDSMYEDNSDAIESVTNEIVTDDPQTTTASVSVRNNDIEQGDKADALGSKRSPPVTSVEEDSSSKALLPERKNILSIDRPTSTSCIRRSRSDRDFGQEKFMGREGAPYHGGQWVDSFPRDKHGLSGRPRAKNVRFGSINNQEAIDYNVRGIYRNESYGIHSGTPPLRDISRDRSRVGLRRAPQQEFDNRDPYYSERKVPALYSKINQGATFSQPKKQSRTRSRSGSPIAWHFQKKRNVDAKKQILEDKPDTRFPFRKPGETEPSLVSQTTGRMSLQCVSRRFDDRNVIDGQYRDRRASLVGTFHRTSQRHDPPGYLGKLKSNDHYGSRFPPSSNLSSRHDDKYGMMNERKRFRYDDNDEPFKGYSRNKDDGFRYTHIESKFFRDPKNRSDEKGCRYTTNKMFNNSGDRHFHKDS